MRSAAALLPVIIALSVIPALTSASTPPILTISYNPIVYGQSDRITVTAASPYNSDAVMLYINNTLVAGPRSHSVNFTICGSNNCLPSGTYSVTAVNHNTGASASENLVVTPNYPTISIQQSSVKYGTNDTITAYPGFYSDYIELHVSGAVPVSGYGVISYDVCHTGFSGLTCLTPGTYNVSVFDKTENVYSIKNETFTVTMPDPPTLRVQYQSVKYGSQDTISASAPVSSDSISIIMNKSTIASGTGQVSYTICNYTPSFNSQPCLPAGTYSVHARDSTVNMNSTIQTITITPASLQLSVSSSSVSYGSQYKVSATAPNPNDSISLYVDGKVFASGKGSLSYAFCSPINGTGCLNAGTHSIYVYDSTSNSYSANQTINVMPVLPYLNASADQAAYGSEVNITGKAPYYTDNLSIILNGNKVENGTGYVGYTICSRQRPLSCLSPATYEVYVADISEGVNSVPFKITVLSLQGSTIATTSIPLTTYRPNTSISTSTTTIQQKTSTSSNNTYIAAAAAVIIIVALAFLLYKIRKKPAIEGGSMGLVKSDDQGDAQ